MDHNSINVHLYYPIQRTILIHSHTDVQTHTYTLTHTQQTINLNLPQHLTDPSLATHLPPENSAKALKQWTIGPGRSLLMNGGGVGSRAGEAIASVEVGDILTFLPTASPARVVGRSPHSCCREGGCVGKGEGGEQQSFGI